MKYDFTTILDRKGHDAIAVERIPIPDAEVEEEFSVIPMWVAAGPFRRKRSEKRADRI